ncbi:MAG: hypothetical protein IT376_22540 [Polyangiaceae bacterium]|nr:hypothetical protein [Polyangiaceae bacterium]
MSRTRAVALGALLVAMASGVARAAPPGASSEPRPALAPPPLSNEAVHAEAIAAIERGALDDAIDRLELLADRGLVHPDASYDRGVAYARRAASPAARAGDAGRACAGFAETLRLRPGDAGARGALEQVRAEVARRRRGTEAELPRPPFARGLFGLVPEDVWAVLAGLGSMIATGALAALLLGRASRRPHRGASPDAPRARLPAQALAVGGLTLASLAAAGVHVLASARRELAPAVVVSAGARLLDAGGVPLAAPPGAGGAAGGAAPGGTLVPEGAGVEVRARRGGLAEVAWGDATVWLRADDLRWLASPP